MILEEKLQKYFGFGSFKKGQKEVISKVLDNQSAAAIFPTGSGKSLCYQLPAMLLPGITLVVSPLLSLMKDQLDFLQEHNIPAARLDSTLGREEYNRVIEQAISNELKILMISVERFKNERFRSNLKRMNVSLLVIDEAHCISEWGHNFRPEYLKLPAYQKEFAISQVLLLTATATLQVIDDMCEKLDIMQENIVATGFYRENLFLQVTPSTASDKLGLLLDRIREDPSAPTIIYVTLQKTAEAVSEFLSENGIDSSFYHAGMKSEDREELQNQFMAGRRTCIVATIAFGMGIDKKDIRRVIHFDLPKSIENYSQEIGRSGRDDKFAWCEVLAGRDNVNVLENFIYGDTPEKNSIVQLLQKIKDNESLLWECKVQALSRELNIRALPLKTLLVYLDMEGLIRPKWTYFEEYAFKNGVERKEIINRFKEERKQFVTAIFDNSVAKKTWTTVNIQGVVDSYPAERQRVVTALNYFEEKGWFELQAKQAVDVYDVRDSSFEVSFMADKMYDLFVKKEVNEIQRIHNMLAFFESDSCISKGLAGYFGEHIEADLCGHCSYCKGGKAVLADPPKLKPLASFDFEELSVEFIQAIGVGFSLLNLVKFLCGIFMPGFVRLGIKQLPYFGVLENYSFGDVKKIVSSEPYFALRATKGKQ